MNNNEMFSDHKGIVTVGEVMDMLRLSKNSVCSLLKERKVKSLRVVARFVIPKENIKYSSMQKFEKGVRFGWKFNY